MNGAGTKRTQVGLTMAAALVLLAGTAGAQGAKPLTRCAPDAVVSGTVCMDKYEAGVWRVPNATTTNRGLVLKIQQGKATASLLTAGGATQLGLGWPPDSYLPCDWNGQNCTDDIYAVSLPGVIPSAYVSWGRAQTACENASKRLPSNAEWQAAAAGTPDPGPDNGTTDCNTNSVLTPVATGSRSSCVSARGAFDMVGNLYEWVADWVPYSTACPGWRESDDEMCLAGGDTGYGPGALQRGGGYASGTLAGPLAVRVMPAWQGTSISGFRCAR
jgi:formylglycine-generating enzyme required for sulfatase activity